ncbi:MAG: diguanylate cyclase, partial [Rhodoferax sp.]|nr:diguanylate cyclase [Rhodoferax sp.]
MALETMLALVAEHTANSVLILDAGRNVLWVNASFARLTGYLPSEVVGRMLADSLRLHQSDPVTLTRFCERLEQGLHVDGEILVRGKLNRDMWASIDMQPVRDGSGVLTGWVVVASDIDEQVRQRQQRAALFQVLPVGVMVYASKGEVLEINPAALEMLGLQREQASDYATVYAAMRKRGRVVREDLSDYPLEDRPVQRTLRSGQPLRGVLIGYARSNGDLAWTMVNTEPLLDDQGGIRGVVMCFVDVTMQKSLERDLRESARTDGLTQLPNRVVVTDRIRESLARRRSQPGYHFAVLFMDFDRFKQVNDTLGHGVGDALLRQIAERLQAGLRPVDTLARSSEPVQLAARIGGDEFVVLLDDVGGDPEVEAVAARLLAALAAPYRIGEHVVNSGVSIGIVTATVASDDVDTILRDADIAMY